MKKAVIDAPLLPPHSFKLTAAARHTLRLPACLSPTPLSAQPTPLMRPPLHAPSHLVSPQPDPPHLLLRGSRMSSIIPTILPTQRALPPDIATSSKQSVPTRTVRNPVVSPQHKRAEHLVGGQLVVLFGFEEPRGDLCVGGAEGAGRRRTRGPTV